MRKAIALIVSATVALVVVVGIARAFPAEMPDPGTVQTNGRVWDILRDPSRDRIYLAGAFTQVTNPDGTAVARSNLAAIDADTGQLTAWNPNATNPANPSSSSVRSMALSADGNRLFVGGSFTRVGGQARARLAALNPLTGAVDPGWKANADKTVHALSPSGSRLYLGGDFATVGGEPRGQLAAVDQATGALDPAWTPRAHRADTNPKDYVQALDVSADGSRVYAGGFFNHVSANDVTTKTGFLTALTSAEDPLAPGSLSPGFRLGYPNAVFDLDAAATGGLGERVFVGTGDPLEGFEALDAATGQLIWSVPGGHPDPEAGDVQAIVASGGKVYAGGHYAQMGGLVRKRLTEADAGTGQISPWAPDIPGNETSNLGVWAVEVDPTRGQLYAGGDFLKVSGQDRQRFARFSQQAEPEPCTISGTANNDVLEGTTGDDVVCGGGGNDTLNGLGGNDTIKGEAGNDTLLGGPGDDLLDGGSGGADFANFSDAPPGTPVIASLTANTATGEGSDTLVGIENLTGSPGGDTLTGSAANDTLNGGNGADGLDGLGGDDTLKGSAGDDTLDSRDGVGGNDSLDGGTHVAGDVCATDATEKAVAGCES